MQSIASLRASNGAVNASVVTIQAIRSPGASAIIANTVLGLPANFIATMGTPHTFVDPVTSEVITVISDATAVDFAGHVNGSNLAIDTIAPGYADTLGSKVGDIVVIKPTTFYADTLANVLAQSHNDDGSFKADSIVNEVPFADNVDPVKRMSEMFVNNVVPGGGVITGLGIGTLLTASISVGVVYINGFRQLIAALATRTYTINKDTYVDALYNAGGTATIVYTEVANGAAAPALAANSVRLGLVVTGASAVTSVTQSGYDSLGNRIYPTAAVNPNQPKLWFEEIGRGVLSANGNSLIVNFPARKYIQFRISILNTGVVTAVARFNNDSAANYALRFQSNAAFGTAPGITQIGNLTSAAVPGFAIMDVLNIANQTKFGHSRTVSGDNNAATIPDEVELYFKWGNNTNQIIRFDLINQGAGNFLAGTEVVVLGHD